MRLILLLACGLIVSCSSSTYHGIPTTTGGTRGTVLIPQGEYPEYTPKLARVLAKNGFNTVTSGPSDYVTELYVGGGFGISSEIIMSKAGVPVITAKASNPGLGTWIVRGPIKNGLFKSSLSKFESQLIKLP